MFLFKKQALKYLTKSYFSSFNNKEVVNIEKILAEDVTVNDWMVEKSNKPQVLDYIQNIFNTVGTIKITPINIFIENNTVIAEIKIELDESITEYVVDIITFNKSNKISKIKAYKR
jgi:hypothetical protein